MLHALGTCLLDCKVYALRVSYDACCVAMDSEKGQEFRARQLAQLLFDRCFVICMPCPPSCCRSGTKAMTESETITKFEIMDGAPVKGKSLRWNTGSFCALPTSLWPAGSTLCISLTHFIVSHVIDAFNPRLGRKRRKHGVVTMAHILQPHMPHIFISIYGWSVDLYPNMVKSSTRPFIVFIQANRSMCGGT